VITSQYPGLGGVAANALSRLRSPRRDPGDGRVNVFTAFSRYWPWPLTALVALSHDPATGRASVVGRATEEIGLTQPPSSRGPRSSPRDSPPTREIQMSGRTLTGANVSLRGLGLMVMLVPVLVLAVAISISPASAASGGSKPCATVTGGRWTFGPYSGTKWQVYVTGSVTCSTGTTWVPRVTRQTSSRPQGPLGWHCVKSSVAGAC
jgi:hypothetical protein